MLSIVVVVSGKLEYEGLRDKSYPLDPLAEKRGFAYICIPIFEGGENGKIKKQE